MFAAIPMRIAIYAASVFFFSVCGIILLIFEPTENIRAFFEGFSGILGQVAAFVGTVGIPYLMWRQSRLSAQSKANEVKISEVKETLGAQDEAAAQIKNDLAESNKTIVKKLDNLTVLTNGPVTAKVRRIAVLARRLANRTRDPGDIREAETAERDLADHLAKDAAARLLAGDSAEHTPIPADPTTTDAPTASVSVV